MNVLINAIPKSIKLLYKKYHENSVELLEFFCKLKRAQKLRQELELKIMLKEKWEKHFQHSATKS